VWLSRQSSKKENLMATQSLRDLYVEEVRDLFDAEQQILEALPSMLSSATSPALKRVFEDHLEQTRVQTERLQLIFEQLGESTRGKRCQGMAGLIQEGRERLRERAPGDVLDAALIAAAQRIEHYEIAGYGTARSFAERLGAFDQAELLQQTLEEEGEADHRLTGIAESGVNQAAEREGTSQEEGLRKRGRLRFVDLDDLAESDFAYSELSLRNRAGDDLGSLDGFVVDGTSGRPVYYVVDSGGWFIGRRYLVPVGKGQLDATARTLFIDLDREQLQRYPEFNTNAFLTMSDEQARGYERRLLATISPKAGREGRYWESYDLPDYTPPAWLATTSWIATDAGLRNTARERPGDPEPARSRRSQAERELITAREDASTTESQRSQPSESVRGIVEEAPRTRRDRDDERMR
jgi:ferritin-like metal-binding protein YciE